MLLMKKSAEDIAQERIDQLDMGGDLTEGTPKTASDITDAIRSGWFNGEDVLRWIGEAVEADRAQRELDDNDVDDRVHEFVVTLSDCTYDEAETVMGAFAADDTLPIEYAITWRNR